MAKCMAKMNYKLFLIIYAGVQVVLFAVFVYLLTTVNPDKLSLNDTKLTDDEDSGRSFDNLENTRRIVVEPDTLVVQPAIIHFHGNAVSNSSPLYRGVDHIHEVSVCNKTSCIYKLVAPSNEPVHDDMPVIEIGRIYPPEHKDYREPTRRKEDSSSEKGQNSFNRSIVEAPVRLNPDYNHGNNTQLSDISSQYIILDPDEAKMCNKSSCVYKLVSSDRDREEVQDDVQQITFGKPSPPELRQHHVGHRRSLRENGREMEEDSVLMKFLGFDDHGAPTIEIKVGPNLLIANPLSMKNVTLIKWYPNIPIAAHPEESEDTYTSPDAIHDLDRTTSEYVYVDEIEVNETTSRSEFTSTCKYSSKDFQNNTELDNITNIVKKDSNEEDEIFNTYIENELNSTVLNYTEYYNVTDVEPNGETIPNKTIDDYDTDFGDISESLISSDNQPKLIPVKDYFHEANLTKEPILNETEIIDAIVAENATSNKYRNLPSINVTNGTESFKLINVDVINISEKLKNITISIENNTIIN